MRFMMPRIIPRESMILPSLMFMPRHHVVIGMIVLVIFMRKGASPLLPLPTMDPIAARYIISLITSVIGKVT